MGKVSVSTIILLVCTWVISAHPEHKRSIRRFGDMFAKNEASGRLGHGNQNAKGDRLDMGDIMFTTGQEEKVFGVAADGRQLSKKELHNLVKDATNSAEARWPKPKAIPFIFSGATAGARAGMAKAQREFAQKTCIRFKQRTNERDYIKIINDGGCYSYVGRIGGVQDLSLGNGCEDTSTVAHELMHALGFWHEQSRYDRDNFIKVIFSNIGNGMANQFQKRTKAESETFGHGYDYDSVMHYDKTAFGYGRVTIKAISASGAVYERNFGQGYTDADVFSNIDIKQLNAMYCGGDATQPPVTRVPPTNGPRTTRKPNSKKRFKCTCREF